MKKIVLWAITALCCTTAAQAQQTEKQLNRQEKKEIREAQEQQRAEAAAQAIADRAFVLEANQLMFRRGQTAFVASNTNFVLVNGDQASVQIAFNTGASGPNGIGGITVDGRITNYTVKTDKKGNLTLSMSVTGAAISAQLTLRLAKGSSNATADVNPNFNSNTLTLSGTLLPLEESSVFKGTAL